MPWRWCYQFIFYRRGGVDESEPSGPSSDAPAKNNNTNGESNFPWAWYKAMKDILHSGDFFSTPQLPVELLPWLYLSNLCSARKKAKLQEFGITHVLTTNDMFPASRTEISQRYKEWKIKHMAVCGQDEEEYDMIGNHWKECRTFILKARNSRNGKVLVHCAAGKNRSALIAAAAMLEFGVDDDDNNSCHLDLLDVAAILSKRRGMVLTNSSFQMQLCRLAQELGRLGSRPLEYTDDEPLFEESRIVFGKLGEHL